MSLCKILNELHNFHFAYDCPNISHPLCMSKILSSKYFVFGASGMEADERRIEVYFVSKYLCLKPFVYEQIREVLMFIYLLFLLLDCLPLVYGTSGREGFLKVHLHGFDD